MCPGCTLMLAKNYNKITMEIGNRNHNYLCLLFTIIN